MIRVKSTKNNVRLGSDQSLNMDEIRQKISSIKQVNDIAKMSSPKGMDRSQEMRLSSNTDNKVEPQKRIQKKRGEFSNLRGSSKTLATEARINVVKPLFSNETEKVLLKQKRPAETNPLERSKNMASQNLIFNDTEESVYSVATSHKINYQSPNISAYKDRSIISKQNNKTNSKYELNSNSSATNSNKDQLIKQKVTTSRNGKQPTKR